MVVAALAKAIFGSSNDRRIKRYLPKVEAINALEKELQQLSDEALRGRTAEFRAELANGKKLEDLLVPAFATVREASRRSLGLRHFDMQLVGGMVLNERAIAEMRTGEGKTLVATLPVYLNALTGNGVHVVTVNDYLARRDSEWMGRLYKFLGLSVGIIVHGLSDAERKTSYAADVTYGTNNEFGFDYLRDNMKMRQADLAQRGHAYAIVDEVDSILVDEARTPLIISGPSEDRSALYERVDKLLPELIGEGDFEVELKHRSATFTDQGIEKLEERMLADGIMKSGSLYDIENVALVHHLNSALKAHKLFQRDKDYIVRDGNVVIIDEFTGRMMPGRRFSEGLHQALEAKEHVNIQPENQTLASITFQNYFRLYKKLAGMTGTAATEAEEFGDIYGLEVVTVPTNVAVKRVDEDDAIYRTTEEKQNAIVELIADCKSRGQPILVGTTSIGKSEELAEMLKKQGYKQKDFTDPEAFRPLYDGDQGGADDKLFAVLNARQHEQESYIVAQAGVPGAVTIATNMAGRGTDIQLGGNADMRIAQELADMPEGEERKAAEQRIRDSVERLKQKALAAGGLYVLGTERHESRRIDNQLRGRSGRQGDPGHSKFFLSLQDDLMRMFPIEQMDSMLSRLGLEDGESITHPWVTKAIERAQARVEARNFDIRKNILKFDDVMNDQRKVIFERRREWMDAESVNDTVTEYREQVIEDILSRTIPERSYPEQWDAEQLVALAKTHLNLDIPLKDWLAEEGIDLETVRDRITTAANEAAAAKEARFIAALEQEGRPNPNVMREIEKDFLLRSLDTLWREHLSTLDHLRQAVGLRGIAQRDPLNEYRQEAFTIFEGLLDQLSESLITQLSYVELRLAAPPLSPPRGLDLSGLSQIQFNPEADRNSGTVSIAQALGAATAMANERQAQAASRDADFLKIELTAEQLRNVRRNDPCPCGSGKKYKHCHGAF